MPERIVLSRKKGWRMPDGAIKVDRTTPWGNPFRPDDCGGSAAKAIELYRRWVRGETLPSSVLPPADPPPTLAQIRTALVGKHLACWCKLGTPCHGDWLLRLANDPAATLDLDLPPLTEP